MVLGTWSYRYTINSDEFETISKKLLRRIQIESVDFQVEGIVPRIAASDVQVKSASLAVFEVGVDDQQAALFNLP